MNSRTHSRQGVAALAAAIALSTLAACGSSDGGGVSGEKVAGVSVFSLSNQFLASEAQLTQSSLKTNGWSTKPTRDAKASVDQQVTDVNNLIAAGATGLIIDPADSSGIVPALKSAERAKVPVVLVDVGATGGKAYMTVRVDNTKAAAQVCEEMGKQLTEAGKDKGTVLELQGILAQQAGRERTKGFDDCMAKNYPNIKIVRQPTDWDAQKAADATQTVTSSQQIDAIYMQSDCAMLTGVLSALKQAGKDAPAGSKGHIILGALDGCPASLTAIRGGQMDFTVEQPLVKYAELAAKFLTDAAAGKKITVGPDGNGGEIVKAPTGYENIVPATLVTKSNVEDETLWGNAAKGN